VDPELAGKRLDTLARPRAGADRTDALVASLARRLASLALPCVLTLAVTHAAATKAIAAIASEVVTTPTEREDVSLVMSGGSDYLKMRWVHAGANAARVVHLSTRRDWPNV
jgi:hypothetical protein